MVISLSKIDAGVPYIEPTFQAQDMNSGTGTEGLMLALLRAIKIKLLLFLLNNNGMIDISEEVSLLTLIH